MAVTEDAGGLHAAATAHLPVFITPPGAADWLLIAMGIFLIVTVIGLGVFYFKLHALPEHMAHKGQRIQYEIVAVLALLALFTHNHAFWIIGLLLALIPIPDFVTPLSSMAQSLARLADRTGGETTDAPVKTSEEQQPVSPRPEV
jgi:hypothetical protein